jgi:hypothetical protein
MDQFNSDLSEFRLLSKSDLSVLIVAFQRSENLRQIIEICIRNGVSRIYISLDIPKTQNDEANFRTREIEDLVFHYSDLHPGVFRFNKAKANRGCGVSVLMACNWIFSHERFAVVLEDDCIPTDGFFNFVSYALPVIDKSDEVLVAVGTQFKKFSIDNQAVVFVKYPVFWGWATTRSQWQLVQRELLAMVSGIKPQLAHLKLVERVYWLAGCRRILQGYVDTWDTLLTTIFLANRWKTMSPLNSLVRNVGNDELATHTSNGTDLHNLDLGTFSRNPARVFSDDKGIDRWMRDSVYQISFRHLFSTKLTFMLDRFFESRRINAPLSERYKNG